MSGRYVDLHMHTTFSDGADIPSVVVERASSLGFSAIAITDHDTLTGLPDARVAADDAGIELLPGVEVSSRYGKMEVHILGLGVDPTDAELTESLAVMAKERAHRAEAIVEKLNALDVPVDYESIRTRVGKGVIGRMHIAQDIVSLGHADTIQGAFDKYIKAGRPAYVPKKAMTCEDAVESIHKAGGLAFVAHPCIGKTRSILDQLLRLPFDGIEVFHSRHTPGHIADLKALAEDRGLLISGGSDCHGSIKGDSPLMGKIRLAWEHYEAIQGRLT
ncbi:MAG: PHP domain-containing protein [Candidatus Hydrogenedentota bacterium]